MKNTRTFLIGLGAIGMGYDYFDEQSIGMTHARAIKMHPNFDFVGAFDIDPLKRDAFETQYLTPSFSSLEQGLLETKPDLVIVAVPTEHHREIISFVLQSFTPGIILCEKPLAYASEEAMEIVSLAKKKGVEIFVNYYRNSDPVTFQLKNYIEKNTFQAPYRGVCTYNKGALHSASHFLNLLDVIFGKPEELILGEVSENIFHRSDPNKAVEIKFSGGDISLEPIKENTKLVFEMQIDFLNGTLFYLQEGTEVMFRDTTSRVSILRSEEMNSNASRYQYDVLDEVSKCLEKKSYRLCNGDDALRYVKALNFDEVEW